MHVIMYERIPEPKYFIESTGLLSKLLSPSDNGLRHCVENIIKKRKNTSWPNPFWAIASKDIPILTAFCQGVQGNFGWSSYYFFPDDSFATALWGGYDCALSDYNKWLDRNYGVGLDALIGPQKSDVLSDTFENIWHRLQFIRQQE